VSRQADACLRSHIISQQSRPLDPSGRKGPGGVNQLCHPLPAFHILPFTSIFSCPRHLLLRHVCLQALKEAGVTEVVLAISYRAEVGQQLPSTLPTHHHESAAQPATPWQDAHGVALLWLPSHTLLPPPPLAAAAGHAGLHC
jgi:hypothetical protein